MVWLQTQTLCDIREQTMANNLEIQCSGTPKEFWRPCFQIKIMIVITIGDVQPESVKQIV